MAGSRALGCTAPSPGAAVQARGLTKRFGEFTAVDGVDFDIESGEAFGFLGPNGAGKTSTMRMIACLSPISGGTLQVLGLDPMHDGPRIRSRIGLVPQDDTLDLELTVRDNLYLYGRYFGLPKKLLRERVDQLLEFARLSERADERVDPLSGGMRRRLTIARALVSSPEPRDPGRADDRSRSPGATLALGPALPAEARGRDPRHHHPLHGRGRAAVRPARGDGRRDASRLRGRRASSSSGGRRVRSWSCVSSPAGTRPTATGLADLAERVEVLPDRLLLYTDEGDATLDAVRSRGASPIAALVRRSTSKTSSCT